MAVDLSRRTLLRCACLAAPMLAMRPVLPLRAVLLRGVRVRHLRLLRWCRRPRLHRSGVGGHMGRGLLRCMQGRHRQVTRLRMDGRLHCSRRRCGPLGLRSDAEGGRRLRRL